MHIAILGNGISGITAARFLRKLTDHQITVISAETDHFFSRTALMYVYMGHMRYEDIKPYEDWFWEKNRIDLKRGYVEQIDFEQKQLHFRKGDQLGYDKLILALGSTPNKFGWPGQDLQGVRGLYSYQDLEYMEAHSEGLERAVIVGGGLIGIEMAEMFHSRHIPVTFLVRESVYWNAVLPKEESEMVTRHIREHGIDLRLSTELKEIVDDGQGRACAVVTGAGERIDCGYVGLTAGVHPNIGWLKDTALETDKGILVDEYLQTNLPDVYAIGDCAQIRHPKPGRRPIEAVWYTGRMMGETVAHAIGGQPVEYDPGVWFNSAKFMDIEYQVYGDVSGRMPDHYASVYWEHADGRKSIRIVYDQNTQEVAGFNLMGVRYRHEVCERWLAQKASVEAVLQNLGLANFDPEYYQQFEREVVAQYNKQTGRHLKLRQKRGLSRALAFLRGRA
ncbi:MAG: NAD(P)/FAD-dependent oxidoreductase [Phaeodactylibacter xiamenensis]|uniref:NADH dehydrogenase n=1 Tax=Phaeodactylibacter xiamenensis TaxID=1524460 RepID=A0A098S6K3_9BACT|nr:FAD-dependent oxidoreductase [Phaeodactylibacter xiamenensis]KGE88039.1 NADH dehydrogenase [Phaeodactylibacter xiamenensis]